MQDVNSLFDGDPASVPKRAYFCVGCCSIEMGLFNYALDLKNGEPPRSLVFCVADVMQTLIGIFSRLP